MKFANQETTHGQSLSTKVTKLPNGQFEASCKNVDLGKFHSDTEAGAVRQINDAINKYLTEGAGVGTTMTI